MLDKTKVRQGSRYAAPYLAGLSVNPVYTCEKQRYIIGGELDPNYYNVLRIATVEDELYETYPRRLVLAWGVVIEGESFAFRATDGRLISFVPNDPT